MSNTLQHHGIKGQRWGVRRTEAQLARARGKRGLEDSHEDYRSAHGKTKVSQMSDKELRQRINRLQMEKQYSQLSKRDYAPGEKFVRDVLRESSKEIAKSYVSKWMRSGISYMVKRR